VRIVFSKIDRHCKWNNFNELKSSKNGMRRAKKFFTFNIFNAAVINTHQKIFEYMQEYLQVG
jgi:hypothetical protein